jgi:ribosomal protein L16/L10AE
MVRAGQVICEVGGVSEILAKRALEAGSKKLPMQTFVLKNLY